jgi:hypothetical protein
MPRPRTTFALAAAALGWLAAAALAPPARAQGGGDVAEGYRLRFRAEAEKGVRLHAQRIDARPDRRATVLENDVRLETRAGGRIQVFADAMVVFGDVTTPERVADAPEVYAEGNVLLFAFGDSFEADVLYLDLRRGDGFLERATARSAGGATRGAPILARAERARVRDGLASFEGERAVLSTCTFHAPHFALKADAVRVRRVAPDAVARVEADAEESADIELDAPTFEVYDVPLFLWPGTLGWDTAWNRWVPRVTAGSSGRFGPYALARVPLYPGKALGVYGTVNGYARRGVGLGGGAEWSGPSGDAETYRGFVDVFRIDDRARTDTSTREPVPDEERLRVKGFHRDDLPLGLRRELEVSYLSDRALLSEYFEPESKQGKEQETVAYLRWLSGNTGATLQGRWRLNDHQDQVEYVPRARFFSIGEPFLGSLLPLGRGIYATTALELSNVRARYDEERLLPSTRVLRLDAEERLDWPFPLGPVQIDPFLLGRYSAWSTGRDTRLLNVFDPRPDERALDRAVLGGGAIATTDLWRDFGAFRHVATPSLGYANVFHVSTPPEELYPVDALEQVRKSESFPVGIRNRIQFWGPSAERPLDLLDWDVTARVFARPDRDSSGERFGPLRSDLRVMPLPSLGGRWRSDWDLNENGGLFRSDAELWFRPQPDVRFALAHRFFENTYRALEGSCDVRLAEKWGLRLSSQYDFEQGSFTSNRAVLVRYFHRFVLDVTVDADFGESDVRFAVHFTPLELYGRSDPLGGDVQTRQDPMF